MTKLFHLKSKRGADAYGMPVGKKFLVFKDSNFAGSIVPCFNETKHRKKLIVDGFIRKINNDYKLIADKLFSSASVAANIVLGSHISGPRVWTRSDGLTLKEIRLTKTT